MKQETAFRLHNLRMENEAVRYDQEELRPRFERMARRHEDGTAPRAVSAYQLFQTPKAEGVRLVASLSPVSGWRWLEPSAGLGRLLDAVQPFNPSEVVAVEMAPQCAGELFRQNRPGVTLLQRDFLTVTPEELGTFDAVAMNPPFHMRSDIRHILHALKFLKPGGRLAALCLDTPHRSRALRDLADTWEELPPETFRAEGTSVRTIRATFTKR